MKNEAFNYNASYDYSIHPNIVVGSMDKICKHCKALKFDLEAPGICCNNGKTVLPILKDPPKILNDYVSGNTPESNHVLVNMNKYNKGFQMTSFGVKKICNHDEFLPTFKIQGLN